VAGYGPRPCLTPDPIWETAKLVEKFVACVVDTGGAP
jgi:hypothetical protein